MKVNGVELGDLDIFDVETACRYEEALEKVVEGSKNLENLKNSDSIKLQCALVFNCFDDLFGEGTAVKVFGEKMNLLVCLKSFEELVQHTNEQKDEIEKITSKYSANRVQRRMK